MRSFVRALVLALGVSTLAACHREQRAGCDAAPPALAAPPTPPSALEVSVRTVDVPVPNDLPAYVVRGARAHRLTMLFVPGMCVHPAGYAMSFQYAAAARGDLVAVQGDVSCGDVFGGRRWSSDLLAMDRRIDAAFVAAGLVPEGGAPENVVVIGYSQGAERAERLVARFPEKYVAAILIASPIVPSPRSFAKARAVVFMAGTLDGSQGTMRAAVSSFVKAGIPATYVPIPGARHGQMGEVPEKTMGEALDFVEKSWTPTSLKNASGGASHGDLPSR